MLVPGPRFAHHSELLFAHAHYDGPVASAVSEYVLDAVRSQLDECGDGGKTLVALIAALIDAFAPLVLHSNLDADLRKRWAEMVSVIDWELSGGPSHPDDREQFLAHELQDVDPDLRHLLRRYFAQAGEAAQLMVVEGPRLEPSLRSTVGYRYQTAIEDYNLRSSDLTRVESPLVLCLDARLSTAEDIQRVFHHAADSGRACVVFCRGSGPLVVPTLLGNRRDADHRWMVYSVNNAQLQDFAAVTGTRVHPWVSSFKGSDYGYADLVEWENGVVGVRRAGIEESADFTAHVDSVLAQRGKGAGHERELIEHRLALLTGDYWELEVGTRYTSAERQFLKERLRLTAQAAANFKHGSGGPYALELQHVVRNYMPPSFSPQIAERVCKALNYENPDVPFPAIAGRIWRRATSVAWLFLSTKVALLGETNA